MTASVTAKTITQYRVRVGLSARIGRGSLGTIVSHHIIFGAQMQIGVCAKPCCYSPGMRIVACLLGGLVLYAQPSGDPVEVLGRARARLPASGRSAIRIETRQTIDVPAIRPLDVRGQLRY